MIRPLASALALSLLALPLLAEEAKKTETPKPKPATTTAAPAQPAQDSPLVAAAKRSNRLGKKPASKVVITNESLKSSGSNAHITSPEQTTELNMPRKPIEPDAEVFARQKAAAERTIAEQAAAKRQAQQAEKKQKAVSEVRKTEEQSGDREALDQLPEDYQGRPEDFEEPPPPPPVF